MRSVTRVLIRFSFFSRLSHLQFSVLSLSKEKSNDPSSLSARFTLKFLEDACSLSKPCRSRPDGSENQRSKGKAPNKQAKMKKEGERERDRRSSGSMDRWIAGGVLSQIGILSVLRVTMYDRKIR